MHNLSSHCIGKLERKHADQKVDGVGGETHLVITRDSWLGQAGGMQSEMMAARLWPVSGEDYERKSGRDPRGHEGSAGQEDPADPER